MSGRYVAGLQVNVGTTEATRRISRACQDADAREEKAVAA